MTTRRTENLGLTETMMTARSPSSRARVAEEEDLNHTPT